MVDIRTSHSAKDPECSKGLAAVLCNAFVALSPAAWLLGVPFSSPLDSSRLLLLNWAAYPHSSMARYIGIFDGLFLRPCMNEMSLLKFHISIEFWLGVDFYFRIIPPTTKICKRTGL